MEGKIVAMLLVFALVVASTFGLNNLLEVDQKGKELSEAQTYLRNARESIQNDRARLEDLRGKLEIAQKKTSMERNRSALRSEVEDLEGQRAKTLEQFSAAVEEVRAKSAGLAVEDINLPNGQVLDHVVIQKVAPDGVKITHGQGVLRIAMDDLPPALKARFRVGMVPVVSKDAP